MIVQCPHCHLRHDLTGRPPETEISCRCGAPLKLPPDGGETAALTCPQCGGQADKNLARCQHCDSALATIRCPTCFGLAFDGNVHCPHCGGSLEAPGVVTRETGRQPLPCPRCRTDLDATVIDKTLIDLCANCGGVWMDHVAFEKLIHNKKFSDLTSALNIPGWTVQQSAVPLSEKEALYVRCPICEHFMHRRNYAQRSGIILDVCAAHGIWFDANELARVLNYRIVDSNAASMRPRVEATRSKTMTIPDPAGGQTLSGRSALELLVALIVDFFS